MNEFRDIYNRKNNKYFSGIRYDIINLIEGFNHNILELGCGAGNTLVELKKQGKAKNAVGIDIIDLGQSKKLDKFILADIENIELNSLNEYFDVIICADVLEHLKDPWSVVRKLKNFLKTDGVLIASIPNVREYRTILSILLNGDFKYVESGILDKTHLRFFCKKNMIDLFESSGLKVCKITYNLHLAPRRKVFNKLTLKFFEEFLVVQYLMVAKKMRF
ncbi:2-polyprenyl-3-methyl-5-hydroxy-6-metoxy-1,4-ben zoquinol methylase [Thermodesulfobium acidiphilum]|uniref:2-polyprenyl-3-methyl-5-hydroxy-6-metoxy-1,4-ben zoquinol methylase n=1 Tax=Thermodesulfobium acidiphilum TaxID=1794699 RepID=A0A2R4W0W0_THEAF|nr:class I SAM-dependent methyltransferase [Thermodesulfobium acidiphilum]AWB10356.1 2-polyprenyl-3-methyl-5-hydroxy-6-metoxy-1,4-ben zoquinol methylase [Thermodesulfobium acidiphilum]